MAETKNRIRQNTLEGKLVKAVYDLTNQNGQEISFNDIKHVFISEVDGQWDEIKKKIRTLDFGNLTDTTLGRRIHALFEAKPGKKRINGEQQRIWIFYKDKVIKLATKYRFLQINGNGGNGWNSLEGLSKSSVEYNEIKTGNMATEALKAIPTIPTVPAVAAQPEPEKIYKRTEKVQISSRDNISKLIPNNPEKKSYKIVFECTRCHQQFVNGRDMKNHAYEAHQIG